MSTFSTQPAKAAIAYHEVSSFGYDPEIRITGRDSCGHYTYDADRGGYWVLAEAFVPESEIDSAAGPSYDVWTAEQEDLGPAPGGRALGQWQWRFDQRFTCEDDPDGKGARHSAHKYARHLRNTYPCAFVAVRPAGQKPLDVRCEQ